MKFVHYLSVLCLSWTSLYGQNHKEIGTLKVGCVFPLTGSMAPLGKEAQAAIQIALEDLRSNPRYATSVPHIEVLFEDDKSHPGGAEQAAERLIKQHRVSLLFGSIGDLNSRAVEKIAKKHNIPVILPTAFPHQSGYGIAGRQPPLETAGALARYTQQTLGIKQVTFLGDSTDSELFRNFSKAYKLSGGKISDDFKEFSYQEKLSKDRAAQLADSLIKQQPLALVTDAPIQSIKPLLNALGSQAPIIISLHRAPRSPELGNYRVLSATSFSNQDKHMSHFNERFSKLTQWKPQKASAMIYDGFLLIGSIFSQVKTTRIDALSQAFSKDHSFQGLHGGILLQKNKLRKTILIIEHSLEGDKIVQRQQPKRHQSL